MALWLLLAIGLVAGQADDPPATETEPPSHLVIDGSKHPERLPADAVWDNLFWALRKIVARRGSFDASDPVSAGLVRANLHMSDEDIAIILPAIAESAGRIDEIKRQVNEGFTAHRPMVETTELRREERRTILRERDALLARLSPQGAKALLRYEAIVRQGMVITYTEESLAQQRLQDAQP